MACLLRVVVAFTAVAILWAEKLPLKRYGLQEGMASETVSCFEKDAAGYLWLCSGGLTQFDGAGFRSFSNADGFDGETVYSILALEPDLYLLSTVRGLYQFRPSRQASFDIIRLTQGNRQPPVSNVLRDPQGGLWVVGRRDLWKLRKGNDGRFSSEPVTLPTVAADNPLQQGIAGVYADEQGDLWVLTSIGRIYRNHQGTWTATTRLLPSPCFDLLYLGNGLSVVASGAGITEVHLGNWMAGQTRTTSITGLSSRGRLFRDSYGTVWASVYQRGDRLVAITKTSGVYSMKMFGPEYGFPDMEIRAISEYPAGTLWIGYTSGGLWKFPRAGVYRFSTDDGLLDTRVRSVDVSESGRLHVVSGDDAFALLLHEWTGTRFDSVRPWTPPGTEWSWGSLHVAFEDSRGQWWMATGSGVFRYPRVPRLRDLANTRPDLVLTVNDGLPSNDVFKLFEDSRGDVWAFCISGDPLKTGLVRWRRADRQVERIAFESSLAWAKAFAEDQAGQLWVAADFGLVRLRGGRSQVFLHANTGLPQAQPSSLFADRQGRLWMGTTLGLLRVSHPTAEEPEFRLFSRKTGLPHDSGSVVQDQLGQYYFASPRGLTRFDPETGVGVPLALPDGLTTRSISGGKLDPRGNLWFQTVNFLLRLVPPATATKPPPPAVRLTGVSAGRQNVPISKLGTARVDDITVEDRGAVAIEYAAPYFAEADAVYYQRRLAGGGGEWSDPVQERTITYPRLEPGHYEFMVRATNEHGYNPGPVASVAFDIPAPVYQRWWFIVLFTSAVLGIVTGFQQLRIRRLKDIAALRDRIAQDLHDDMGASLTKISILSEVARSRTTHGEDASRLSEIARTARNVINSLSYTVWAISPANDSLKGLVRGTQRLASDLFSSGDVRVDVQGPHGDAALPADVRRQAYLMINEALNNAVRHSHCTEIRVRISVDGGALTGEIQDNGRGFSPDVVDEGNGLRGLRRRAQALHGSVEIVSNTGSGVAIRFRLPIAR